MTGTDRCIIAMMYIRLLIEGHGASEHYVAAGFFCIVSGLLAGGIWHAGNAFVESKKP